MIQSQDINSMPDFQESFLWIVMLYSGQYVLLTAKSCSTKAQWVAEQASEPLFFGSSL